MDVDESNGQKLQRLESLTQNLKIIFFGPLFQVSWKLRCGPEKWGHTIFADLNIVLYKILAYRKKWWYNI